MKKLIALLPLLAVLATAIDAQCCGSKSKCGDKPAACSAEDGVAKAATGHVSTGALVAMMKAKVPMTIVDARKDAAGALPGAKSVCEKSAGCEATLAKVVGPKDRLVVTYCAGPKCSASTKMAARLRAAGYTNVVEYSEGIQGWKSAMANAACGSKANGECSKGACTDGAAKGDCSKGACPSTGETAKGSSCCPSTGAVAKAAAPKMPASTIDAAGLRTLINAKVPVVIVDARTGKWDDGMRIPGARAIKDCTGSCWTKAETYKNIVKSKDALVVTYCGAKVCPLSSTVAKKLRAAGYTNVIEFKGGVADWKKAGYSMVKSEAGCCGGSECPSKTSTEKAGGCCGSSKAKAKTGGCCGSKSKT